jgi:dUTP pyrophosphatase
MCALVMSRSGLAARHGLAVLNAPGLVDSGYRGEIMVPLINTDPTTAYEVSRGDRIAQLVVMAVPTVGWQAVSSADELGVADTRGSGGFGSSGR